jgi:multidrug efflux pump subunit AcrA (membrane-fusion protein)
MSRYSLILISLLFTPALIAAEVSGRVEWQRQVVLTPIEAGTITAVHGIAGMAVTAGTPLLQLDDRLAQAERAAAEAVHHLATLRQREATADLARTQELYDAGLIADHDLIMAQIALAAADEALLKAEAARQSAMQVVEQLTLRAPFDATLLWLRAEVGQVIAPLMQRERLVAIAGGGLQIRAAVSLADRQRLRIGQLLTVQAAGRSWSGELAAIEYEDGYQILVTLPQSAQERLVAGQPARVVVP